MQDFIEQANKNGVTLYNIGPCQFCGADYQRGIFECMDNYNRGIELLDFNNPGHHTARFLSVDAHALQHPEIHGRWSNHFHLTRLHLILDKKVKWDYKKSPLLSAFLNQYKLKHPKDILFPPKQLERGSVTAKELSKATTAHACIELVNNWAHKVYQAWGLNHLFVSEIADGFLNENKQSGTKNKSGGNNVLDIGPFYHGTKADLRIGDLLTAGFRSNYKPEVIMNHIYFSALNNGAGLAAALAKGDGRERVYIVEPTGEFENDPNVTDKKFPGNPTRSYRSQAPVKIVGELTDWVRQTDDELQIWREKLANIKGDIIN